MKSPPVKLLFHSIAMKKNNISDIINLFLLFTAIHVLVIAAHTDPADQSPLLALKRQWKVRSNWVGNDPCGSSWNGIKCNDRNRIIEITLASTNLEGSLTSDVVQFSELQTLDLSYNPHLSGSIPEDIGKLANLETLILIGCGISGSIPNQTGQLPKLITLSLNKNFLSGEIPPSIGNLQNLYWLDLADNQLSGSIPVSNVETGTLGLDMLYAAKHFHLGNNRFSGSLPPKLFSNLTLIHFIVENNRISGTIPLTLGLVKTLEVLRLDQNSFIGYVPENLNNLTSLQELYLSNNMLSGPLPVLSDMVRLSYVDMSNNSFDATDIAPWFSSADMESLTTLVMENTQLQGELPEGLFALPRLQKVAMKNNNISGALNLGLNPSTQLRLIDLQKNLIDGVVPIADDTKVQIILLENKECSSTNAKYCNQPSNSEPPYSTRPQNCVPYPCASDMVSSPTCKCSYPYIGTFYFRAPSFSDLENTTLFTSLQDKMMYTFQSHGLPVDSVSVSNPTKQVNGYLKLTAEVFPSGQDNFNQSGISTIAFLLSNHTFKQPIEFGPYYFIPESYTHFPGSTNSHKPVSNIIIGAAVGGAVLFLLLLIAGIYAFIHKRRHDQTASQKNGPFASWDPNSKIGGVPQIKGAKCFSLEELRQCTNNFSEMNLIGVGGFGKVYRGTLRNGQLVAVKRSQEGSFQGGLEFKTEIELLSRVHHKNVINLVGFCFQTREQLLVYEYAVNSSLKDSLSGKSGIRLDWTRRLKICLGAAKGIHYLHDLVNPPVIHRDIKSQNVMLDERLNAKISDFGLSKLVMDSERDHLTTQVKGTMGYLDPEYCMTQRLTEKSDVYSFGVLLFELLTSRTPIENGKYIVREVKEMMDKSKRLYNLQELLDPIVASAVSAVSIEMFVDLALKCVQEKGRDRPWMREVVKEIEKIMEEAGLNPNLDSASTSASHGSGSARSPHHPYSNESLMTFSGNYSASK